MRPAEEFSACWHDLTNLPKFMSHLKQVEVPDNGKSKWMADAPFGATVRRVASPARNPRNFRGGNAGGG